MAGMRAVAQKAGVSLSTVSAVLGSSSDKYVSEEIRSRVLEAAEELGYAPPVKAEARTKTIAVILPIITSPFFSNVLSGVEGFVFKEKKMMLYYNTNYEFDREQECLHMLKRQRPQGIILSSVCPREKEEAYHRWIKKTFIDKGIFVVIIEKKVETEGFYSVYVDHFQAEKQAVAHLISLGHRKIAYLYGNRKVSLSRERFEGYRSALSEAGISFNPGLVRFGDFTPASGYMAMRELLDFGEEFTAVASANDQMAIGAIKAVKQTGKSVPEDIAFIGFDNLSVSTLIDPALSTIHVPTYQMGRLAAQIIGDLMQGIPCTAGNILESSLIVRKSSDISASNEWEMFGW